MLFNSSQTTLIIVVSGIIILFLFGIRIVPKNKVYIVERMGVYYTTWNPGIHFLLIGVERVREKIPTNKQIVSKSFGISNNTNTKYTFNSIVHFIVSNYENYGYRKDIVLFNLDEIIFSTLESIITKNDNPNQLSCDEMSSNLLNKLQNHMDLIDLEITNVEISFSENKK